MNELILVADDDATARLLLKENLERQGYLVTTVDDGAQAVLKIQEIKPNLVILDVKMPGSYGPSLYASLQADPSTAGIPVLFVSSFTAGEEVVHQRVPAGPTVRFLAKPLNLAELDRVVLELLGQNIAKP